MAGDLADSSDPCFGIARLVWVVRKEPLLEVPADVAQAPLRVFRLEVARFLLRVQLLMRDANLAPPLVPVVTCLYVIVHRSIALPFPSPLPCWTLAATGSCTRLQARIALVLRFPAATLHLLLGWKETRIHCARSRPPNVWAVHWRSLNLAECSLKFLFVFLETT